MLTHMHMVLFTWWCWHICKGEGVGVDVDQLWEARKVFWSSPEHRTIFLRASTESLATKLIPVETSSKVAADTLASTAIYPKFGHALLYTTFDR